jgi:hypothetical protein
LLPRREGGVKRSTLRVRWNFASVHIPSRFGKMAQCTALAVATQTIPFGTAIAPIYTSGPEACGPEPGVSDGMKVDTEGNVYCGGAGGIWIMHPKGKKLGRIRWLTRFWSGMDSNWYGAFAVK